MEHKLWLSWLLILTIITIFLILGSQGVSIEEERKALLEIKASLINSYGYGADVLPTWVYYGECCDWERVNCNATSGRVIILSLHNLEADLNVGMMIESEDHMKKLWPLNVSLFLHFEELSSLDLSWNYLDDQILNTEIKKLSRLKKLEILDLGSNFNIDNAILPSLSTLTSLRVLRLSNTGLKGPFPTNEFAALENLKELDLTMCAFNGFERPLKLDKLETLTLTDNSFNESILSSLKFLPSLKNLNLSGNELSGPFPPQGSCNARSLPSFSTTCIFIPKYPILSLILFQYLFVRKYHRNTSILELHDHDSEKYRGLFHI